MRDSYTHEGYEIPRSRQLGLLEGQRRAWNPAVDEDGNIVQECYMLPLDFIEIHPYTRKFKHIQTHEFVIGVLGECVGFTRVEFPVLDCTPEDGKVALVKLYRAKMEKNE